jgi:hypothetical protein
VASKARREAAKSPCSPASTPAPLSAPHAPLGRLAVERELADGLEHAEAAAVAGDQGVVGERGDAVQRVGAADALGGVEREAADEHAELGEQPLRGVAEQVVAPADRGPQRLLAFRRVAGTAAEQIEAAAQAVEDLRHRRRARAPAADRPRGRAARTARQRARRPAARARARARPRSAAARGW